MRALIAACLMLATPCMAAQQHAPLSALETHNLTAALAQAKRGEVTIICAGDWCRDLAANVSAVFHAAKWKVHDENVGGMGVDGVKGIRLDVQGIDGKSVAELLKRSTNRHIDFIDVGATQPWPKGWDDRCDTPARYQAMSDGANCSAQRPMIYLVIGTP